MAAVIATLNLFLHLMCKSLSPIIKRRLEPIAELTTFHHILIVIASIAGQLTLLEVIVFVLYMNVAFAAFMFTKLFSFIGLQHSSLAESIPPLVSGGYNYSLGIKDNDMLESVRPGARAHHLERGSNKPAIQCIPTYVTTESFVHSPVEECMDRIPDVLTSSSIQGSVLRGRNEAVSQAEMIAQTEVVLSVQPTSSEGQPKDTKAQPLLREEPKARKVHTAPCRLTTRTAFRSLKRKDSLLGSLKGVPLRPSALLLGPSRIHILGVGLSWKHINARAIPGPSHDIAWLERFFAYQKQTQFTSLLDENASFEAIRKSVTRIYENARPGDHIILYFTGHGNEKNALELYDIPGSLDEIVLNRWIVELRQREPSRPSIPIHIIFDFCRENPDSSNAQLDADVNVIWSCPPGQSTPDIALSPDLPFSSFLTALLLAIGDESECCAPSARPFAMRLIEISNVVWGTRCYRSRSRKRWCRHLHSCEVCQDDRGGPNDEDWMDLRLFEVLHNMYLGAPLNFSALVRYALAQFPIPIRKVRQVVEVNQWFLYFNPSRISSIKGSPRFHPFLPRGDYDVGTTKSGTRSVTLPPGLFLVRPVRPESIPQLQSKPVRS
ncbi:hypothetical protein RSOLAG1IB_01636 [Rhizoctonia solani AG-1 IB]|uniref:Peptidase C14 caspase domain-containing protein n=1 Tax=Thanatephorus cucumeris (strain AG1-IB / isolate 7/3/14) TaxID=1108050 RepID=A0A0B7FFH3_THACB|nr:hypothetical protein RSOLAG1IB_01636 [Rhizoctonia solani AG-1 IB]